MVFLFFILYKILYSIVSFVSPFYVLSKHSVFSAHNFRSMHILLLKHFRFQVFFLNGVFGIVLCHVAYSRFLHAKNRSSLEFSMLMESEYKLAATKLFLLGLENFRNRIYFAFVQDGLILRFINRAHSI